jgi:D-alanine-D-alanine ligase
MRSESSGGEWFAETFVEGREFNLSILADENGPEVLPPAEIIFEGYSEEMPKIVDYRAKWDETAYSYHHTPRNFDFASSDLPLLETLKKLALDCWKVFDLRGYARVDFRVDTKGAPWVLEVNANPCLSTDAGFAAALERAGISFKAAVDRILKDVKL